MKTLSEIVTETVETQGFILVLSLEQAKEHFKNNHIDGFLDVLYGVWDEYKTRPGFDPFPPLRMRPDGAVKLARIYQPNKPKGKGYLADVLFAAMDNAGIKYTVTHNNLIVNDVLFIWGNGSPKGYSSSKRGLDYEIQMVGVIKNVIRELANGVEPAEVFKECENLHPIYTAGDFSAAVEYAKKHNKPNDLDDIVRHTGKISTMRNKFNSIFDKNTKLNTHNKRQIIKASGATIADIQIVVPGKEPVNISVKLEHAQLSAISQTAVMQSNKGFKDALKRSLPWSDVKNEPYMVNFINAFELMGLDAEAVYNFYLNKENKKTELITCDSNLISDFFAYIIGGNYWYVTPDPKSTVFVPWNRDYKVWIDTSKTGNITATGTEIKSPVKIANYNSKYQPYVVFRNDQGAKYDFPARFYFYNISVADVIGSIK